MRNHLRIITALVCVSLVATACRSTLPPGSMANQRSAKEGEFKQEWTARGADLSRFNKIQLRDLDTSGVKQKDSILPKFGWADLKPEDSVKLQRVFRREVEKRLKGGGFTVVPPGRSVGSDTLVMKPKLIQVETPVIWLNIATFLFLGGVTTGGASFKADFHSGGSEVAEVGEVQSGAWHLGSILIGGLFRTYDAERVFQAWGKRTVKFLQDGRK